MRNFLGKLLLILLGLIVTFFMLEAGIRLLKVRSAGLVIYDPHIARIYKTNIDTTIRSEDYSKFAHIKSNDIGFLSPEPFVKTDDDTTYIAHFGDSFTAALQVDYDKNFTALVEKELNANGVKAKSWNFGVGGQGTGHVHATYLNYARQYSPDVSVYWIYLGNDFEDNLTYEEGTEDGYDENASFIKRWGRKSELAHFVISKAVQVPFLAKFLHGTVLTRVGDDTLNDSHGLPLHLRLIYTKDKENSTSLFQTEKYLNKLNILTREDEGKLLVIMIPAQFQVDEEMRTRMLEEYPGLLEVSFDKNRANKELSKILVKLDIPYLDLSPHFESGCALDVNRGEREWCSLYMCQNCHLSQEGHNLATEKAVEFLSHELFSN